MLEAGIDFIMPVADLNCLGTDIQGGSSEPLERNTIFFIIFFTVHQCINWLSVHMFNIWLAFDSHCISTYIICFTNLTNRSKKKKKNMYL